MSLPPLPQQQFSVQYGNLKQEVTYWAVTDDGFGGHTFLGPYYLMGRWEEKQQLIITAKGVEEVSQAQVYLSHDVSVNGYLFLGRSTSKDPTNVGGTHIIRQFNRIPAGSGTRLSRKAFL